MLPRRTLLVSLLIVALLTAGCAETIKSYHELRAVEDALTKKFGEDVSVDVNGGHDYGTMMMVWFINSPLNDGSAEQRMARAAEAARIVKETYRSIQKVRELWVGFLRKKTRFAVFHHNQIVAMHGFNKDASPLPGYNDDREQPTEDIQVTTNYDPTNKWSDISVSGIQLEGKPGGLGVTALPYFILAGDARAGKKLPPPKIVEFNFASYAQKPTFKQTVPITFVADGKVVLETEGDFMGHETQFCYLKIPYSAFKSMVSGKELKIKLGDKEYLLTPSQLGAMKHMTEFVKD